MASDAHSHHPDVLSMKRAFEITAHVIRHGFMKCQMDANTADSIVLQDMKLYFSEPTLKHYPSDTI